jgi:hypothetical protein
MNIIIAGDSYGCGVWEQDGPVRHKGLEKYLTDNGHRVVNISESAISNLDIWKRLEIYFQRFPEQTADIILVFQTEWHRDFKHVHSWTEVFTHKDWNEFDSVEEIESQWISRFYTFLSELTTRKSIPIYIIGGASDTMWFDDMSLHYPGCSIACQSITNLLVHGNHRTSQPVFSCYSSPIQSNDLIKHIRSTIKSEHMESFVDNLTRAYNRIMIQNENPDHFWPDGNHPNEKGHWVLYNFLKDQKII